MTMKRYICVFLSALLILLCGCGIADRLAEDSGMEQILRDFMACIEQGDEDRAAAMCEDPERVREIFPKIAEYWHPTAADPIESTSINVTEHMISKDEKVTVSTGTFVVHSQDGDYQVNLVVRSDAERSVIQSFNVMNKEDIQETEQISGSPVWLTIALWVVMLAFCAFSIIDCIKKKPKGYGWAISACLVFFSFVVTRTPAGTNFGFRILLLAQSGWQTWSNGTTIYQISIPIGAICYWLARKGMLKKKAEMEAAEAEKSKEISAENQQEKTE